MNANRGDTSNNSTWRTLLFSGVVRLFWFKYCRSSYILLEVDVPSNRAFYRWWGGGQNNAPTNTWLNWQKHPKQVWSLSVDLWQLRASTVQPDVYQLQYKSATVAQGCNWVPTFFSNILLQPSSTVRQISVTLCFVQIEFKVTVACRSKILY